MKQSIGEKFVLMSRAKPLINGNIAAIILVGIGIIYAVSKVFLFHSHFPSIITIVYCFCALEVFQSTAFWRIIDKKDRQIDDLKRDLAAYQDSLQAMRLSEKTVKSENNA